MASFPPYRFLARANNEKIVESISDFGPLVIAPDGNLRYKLSKDTMYSFDFAKEGLFNIDRGFWIEDADSTFLQATSLHSLNNTHVLYTDTVPLFYAENLSFFSLHRIVWQAATPGTQLFDMQGSIDPATISVIETTTSSFLGFDLGRLVNIDATKLSFVANSQTGPIRLHNASILNSFRDMTFNTSIFGATGRPAMVFTGEFDNIMVDNLKPILLATDSFLAIDSGTVIGSRIYIVNTGYPAGSAFDFFEADLTGSLTQFQDLSTLITGTASNYEQAANGQVKVTHDGNASLEIGSQVTHSGTTNYNGTFEIVQMLGLNAYVMDATYVADEVSGSFTGSGTRVTTSGSHIIDEFRTVTISGTTNYNGSFEAHNISSTTFDINTAFVADDATGSYLVTSQNKGSVDITATNNGALAESVKIAALSWNDNTDATAITSGAYTDIDLGSSVDIDAIERFEVVDSAAGRLRILSKEGFCGVLQATLTISSASNNTNYRFALSVDEAVPDFGTAKYLPIELKTIPVAITLQFVVDITANQTIEINAAGDGTGADITITDGSILVVATA